MSTQKKLLCIDDEENGLKLRKLLFEREGHQVLTAADGPRSANQTPALRAISSRQLCPRPLYASVHRSLEHRAESDPGGSYVGA